MENEILDVDSWGWLGDSAQIYTSITSGFGFASRNSPGHSTNFWSNPLWVHSPKLSYNRCVDTSILCMNPLNHLPMSSRMSPPATTILGLPLVSPSVFNLINSLVGSYLRRWGSLQGSAFVGVCYTEDYQWTLVLPSKVWIMHPRVSPFSHEPTTYSKDGSPWRPWHCANEVI